MANIVDELYAIMTAITGEEVRESIWEAIRKINSQVDTLAVLIGETVEIADIVVTSVTADSGLLGKLVLGSHNDTSKDVPFAIGNGSSQHPGNLFDVDDSGNVTISGNLDVGGLITGSSIGTVQVDQRTVAIGASHTIDGTPALGGQLTLDPGTYLLVGRFVFDTGATANARTNQIAIFSTATNPTNNDIIHSSIVRVRQPNENWASLITATVVSPELQTTYVVGGESTMANRTQTGGASFLYAIKLA